MRYDLLFTYLFPAIALGLALVYLAFQYFVSKNEVGKILLLSMLFLVLATGIGGYLVDAIRHDIVQKKKIAKIEAKIIKKLEMIRDAEVAFRDVNDRYTGSFDTLKQFIENGEIFITQKREKIITLDYGADSIHTEIDTLGVVSVMDSLFSKEKYPNFKLEELSTVPGTGETFELFASTIEKGGVQVDVFEAKDPAPINPARQEDGNKKPLRVGSRTEVTTAGNWE